MRSTFQISLFLSFLGLASAGCAAPRVLITPEQANSWQRSQLFGIPKGPYWQPAPEQLRDFERQLALILEAERSGYRSELTDIGRPGLFHSYGVQFIGFERDGRRLIKANGFCNRELFAKASSSWILVLDGGECFFEATYDPATRTIESFGFHGVA